MELERGGEGGGGRDKLKIIQERKFGGSKKRKRSDGESELLVWEGEMK